MPPANLSCQPRRPAVSLPRVSRNQFDAGRKVPVSDLRAGDMVFYRRGAAPIHHVALYVGDGQIVHAPRTGRDVSEESMYSWTPPNFFARV